MKKEQQQEFTYITPNPPNNSQKSQPISKKGGRVWSKKSRSGYNWSYTENKLYLKFLINNKDIFTLPILERKKIKINVKLSKKIPTRQSTQCHTHHQKMMLKYGSIDNIIAQLSKIYPISNKNPKKQAEIKMEQDSDPFIHFTEPNHRSPQCLM